MGLGYIRVIFTVSAAVMTGRASWTRAIALHKEEKVSQWPLEIYTQRPGSQLTLDLRLRHAPQAAVVACLFDRPIGTADRAWVLVSVSCSVEVLVGEAEAVDLTGAMGREAASSSPTGSKRRSEPELVRVELRSSDEEELPCVGSGVLAIVKFEKSVEFRIGISSSTGCRSGQSPRSVSGCSRGSRSVKV